MFVTRAAPLVLCSEYYRGLRQNGLTTSGRILVANRPDDPNDVEWVLTTPLRNPPTSLGPLSGRGARATEVPLKSVLGVRDRGDRASRSEGRQGVYGVPPEPEQHGVSEAGSAVDAHVAVRQNGAARR